MAADQGVEILRGPADLPHRNFDEMVGSRDVMCGSVLRNESLILCLEIFKLCCVLRRVRSVCDLRCVDV